MLCFIVADTMVSTGCCSILDNIVSFLFKKVTKKSKRLQNGGVQHHNGGAGGDSGDPLVRILEMRPEILQQVKIFISRLTTAVRNIHQ